jgi:large-conductance mechanosensitive channel
MKNKIKIFRIYMNYSQFDAANVNFGNPNEPPSNPYGTQALNIPQQQTQQTQQTQQQTQKPQQKSNFDFFYKIQTFLNGNTGTVLSTAIGMAIGFSFKDFITSSVTHILEPLIIKMLSLTPLNNYYNLAAYITQENTMLDIKKFFSALFAFIFTVITVYYISKFISFI